MITVLFDSEVFIDVCYSIKENRILSTENYLVIARHDKNQNKLSFTPRNSPRVHLSNYSLNK